jgi:predicted DNA-binding transcriptional regulator AlpA
MEPPRLVSTKQLASMLSVSERHLYRLMSAGKLPPPIRIGRCLRWRLEDFPGLGDRSPDGPDSTPRR